jgi:hypothetical protein
MRRLASALLWLALGLLAGGGSALAESRVFAPVGVQPQQVLETVRALYGDQVRAEVINQRLVVVGSAEQVAEIGELITQLDRVPAPLRLILSEHPPLDEIAGTVYRSGTPEHHIDTVEGALVEIEATQLSQRASGDGWWVAIEEVPTRIEAIALQVRLREQDKLEVTYSFTRHRDGERRVYGNQLAGDLGRWMALLPRIDTGAITNAGGTLYSTVPRSNGAQLYLKVERVPGAGAAL